jgi:hypothetical protein
MTKKSPTACVAALPPTVKIGAYDWVVAIMEGQHEEMCGQADFEVRHIRLWPDNLTSAAHAVGIFLHECLHVIYDIQGLENMKRSKDDREEQVVLGFEAGIVSLFRDNPKLLTWMKKWL